MSAVRALSCAEPGPWDYHCTKPRGHQWSCYDPACGSLRALTDPEPSDKGST